MSVSDFGRATCPACRVQLRIERIRERRIAPCPKCGGEIRIPEDVEILTAASPAFSSTIAPTKETPVVESRRKATVQTTPQASNAVQTQASVHPADRIGELAAATLKSVLNQSSELKKAGNSGRLVWMIGATLLLGFIAVAWRVLGSGTNPNQRIVIPAASVDLTASLADYEAKVERLRQECKDQQTRNDGLAKQIKEMLGKNGKSIEEVLSAFEAQKSSTTGDTR